MIYGLESGKTSYEEHYNVPRDVVSEISLAPVGNVVLRISRESEDRDGFYQIAHIVLTPEEAWRFGTDICHQAGEGANRAAARMS